MTLPITFRCAARHEFDQAYDWYEQQRAGLGEAFSQCVQDELDQIADLPELHQVVYKDVRRAVVSRFPYSIYYRVKADKIVVVAVFHCKRNPAIWKRRV